MPNDVGGYTYWSDEIGGGVFVWDTCLVDNRTLRAAIDIEARHGLPAPPLTPIPYNKLLCNASYLCFDPRRPGYVVGMWTDRWILINHEMVLDEKVQRAARECLVSCIGYNGTFSQYRVFESYAHMRKIWGAQGGFDPDGKFYDAVIPNYLNPADYPYQPAKEDYYLYLGRLIQRKGIDIAVETCKRLAACGQTKSRKRPFSYSASTILNRTAVTPWPTDWPPYYHRNEPCDMLVGPCSCGAWHTPGEFELVNDGLGQPYVNREVIREWPGVHAGDIFYSSQCTC